MWDIKGDQKTAENRERELIVDFWQPLMSEGAKTGRFDNSSDSAWRIVTDILTQDGGIVRTNPCNEVVADDIACCCFGF